MSKEDKTKTYAWFRDQVLDHAKRHTKGNVFEALTDLLSVDSEEANYLVKTMDTKVIKREMASLLLEEVEEDGDL